jgi:hypothetical protein
LYNPQEINSHLSKYLGAAEEVESSSDTIRNTNIFIVFLIIRFQRIYKGSSRKNMSKKNLVIFSGSNRPSFFLNIQQELILIANNLDTSLYHVWYGGGESGLMGVIPYHFHHHGGQVSSVDAQQFVSKYGKASFGTCWVMDTFTERQNILIDQGDIFLCLPGGIGTLSELIDVLVNNDVNGKDYKIIIFSYQDFFKPIIDFIFKNIESGFIRQKIIKNIHICYTGEEVLKNLKNIKL